MKKLLIVLLATFSFSANAAVIAQVTWNGSHYYLLSSDTWQNSEVFANTLGGHLATINDQQENDFLWNQWGSNGWLWIGLNDVVTEGTYVWSSGEAVTFTNWAQGEPNNLGNEDYGHLWGPVGTWNDWTAGGSTFGIAEVKANVPEPSTLGLFALSLLALRRFKRA